MAHELLQFFVYEHLPEKFQVVSKPFCELAHELVGMAEGEFTAHAAERIAARKLEFERASRNNVETTWASVKLNQARGSIRDGEVHKERLDWVLRLVLEAKDCAVRSALYKAP